MARAVGLTNAAAVNRRKNGQPGRPGAINLPNLPGFQGPPPGTFDPGLEAEVRAAERGLFDLIDKTRREGRRESRDTREARMLLERKVRQGRSDLSRNRGYALQDAGERRGDLGINFERDLQDLSIARQQGQENYDKALTDMQHRYARVAAEQTQAQVAQGTDDAGTSAASEAVRSANSAYEKGELDTSKARADAALALREGRVREDYARNLANVDQGLGRQLTDYGIQNYRLGLDQRTQRNRLQLEAARNRFDRRNSVSQAKREYGIYATDIAQQAYYQAHQLNPNIVFPGPTGQHGGAGGGATPHGPAVGSAAPAPHGVGVGTGGVSAALNRGVGLGGVRPVIRRRPRFGY